MNGPSDFTTEKLNPYLHKGVVVSYKDKEKGIDAQIIRGTLDGVETGENDLPIALVIRNESGDRLKIPISNVQDFREDE